MSVKYVARSGGHVPFCRNCKSEEILLEFVADTGASPTEHYAYNVYRCRMCDTIAKEVVWRDPVVIVWITTDNTIFFETVAARPEAGAAL